MKKVLLLLANGFEVYEASVFIDVMGWNKVYGNSPTELITCGLTREVKSSFDHKFLVNSLVDEVNPDEFDALAIPGGFEIFGFYNDAYHEKFLNLIRTFNEKSRNIASVCVGALPLGKSGILNGKRATTYNKTAIRQETLRSFGVNVINQPIVIEGNIITSWNPSTAIEVALNLLEMLTSAENANHIRDLMGFKNA